MRGNAARALVPWLVVLALVAVVTIAATGSTPSGSGDTREPADALLDTFFSLMLLAYVPAAALLIWALMQRRQIAEEMATGRYQRNGLVAFCALILIFGALAYRRRRDGGGRTGRRACRPDPRRSVAERRTTRKRRGPIGVRARARLDSGARRRRACCGRSSRRVPVRKATKERKGVTTM